MTYNQMIVSEVKVAQYYLFAWGVAVLKWNFWLLNSIPLLRCFRRWKSWRLEDLKLIKKRLEKDLKFIKSVLLFRSIWIYGNFFSNFLNVAFKETAYYQENEKTFFLPSEILKDFRDQVSDKSAPCTQPL